MIEQDELDHFEYRIFDTDGNGDPMPKGDKRIVSTGYYRGVKVIQMSLATDELIQDAIDFSGWLKRSLTDWARDNWPPPPMGIDTPTQSVLE